MTPIAAALMTAVLQASPQAPPSATSAPPQARPEIAAEVERGVRAYNAQDLAFYQATLAPEAVYIADDGAVFAGKERVVGLFTRLFARPVKPQLEVSDIVTGGRGDVAWARFNWTLSGTERPRPGVATIVFVRAGGGWQAVSIQNTARHHAMRAATPSPAPSPSPSPHRH